MTHAVTIGVTFLSVVLSGLAVGYLHYAEHKDYADVVVEHVAMRALKIADTVNTIKWHQRTNTSYLDSMDIAYANITDVATRVGCSDSDIECMRKECDKDKANMNDDECKTYYLGINQRTYYPTDIDDSDNFVKKMQQYAWSVEYHLTGYPRGGPKKAAILLRLNEQDLVVVNPESGVEESLASWGRADDDQISKCQRAYKSKTDLAKKDCTLYQSNVLNSRLPIVFTLESLEIISRETNTTERKRLCFEECDLQMGFTGYPENRADLITSCMLLLPGCSTVAAGKPMIDDQNTPALTSIDADCWKQTTRSYHSYNEIIRYTWFCILALSAPMLLVSLACTRKPGKEVSIDTRIMWAQGIMALFSILAVACVLILVWGGLYSAHSRNMFEHKNKKPTHSDPLAPEFHNEHCFGRHTAHTMGYTDTAGNWITLKANWAAWNIANDAIRTWKDVDQTDYTTHMVLRGDRRMGHSQIMQPGPQMRSVHVSLAMASLLALVFGGATILINQMVKNNDV
jgi:hypothetical protein